MILEMLKVIKKQVDDQAEFTVYQNDAYRKGDLLLGNNKKYVVEKSKGEEAVCKPSS